MIGEERKRALKKVADPVRVAELLGLDGNGKRFWCPSCQPGGAAEHRTPDLSVRPEGWRCHKCGMHGDSIALVQAATGETFPAAVDHLEGLLGIQPGEAPRDAPTRPRPSPQLKAPPELYEAFMVGCRALSGEVLAWTETKAITPAVVEAADLRFCGRELPDLLGKLRDKFTPKQIAASGLESLMLYHAKRVGFVVFPCRHKGRPVALKCRPPISKAKAKNRELPRFLQCGSLSVPFGVDLLERQPGEVVILCEGETDTLAALSAGAVAIGIPGARAFNRSWVELFRGRRVRLAFDPDKGGQEGTETIADLFEQDGQPRPKRFPLPAGLDMSDHLAARLSEQAPETDIEPAKTSIPTVEDVKEWTLRDLGQSRLILEVDSDLLGESVLFAGNDVQLPADEKRVSYTAAELKDLVSVPAEALRLVHEAKRTFTGARVVS